MQESDRLILRCAILASASLLAHGLCRSIFVFDPSNRKSAVNILAQEQKRFDQLCSVKDTPTWLIIKWLDAKQNNKARCKLHPLSQGIRRPRFVCFF
jgi:hypothetical protein